MKLGKQIQVFGDHAILSDKSAMHLEGYYGKLEKLYKTHDNSIDNGVKAKKAQPQRS